MYRLLVFLITILICITNGSCSNDIKENIEFPAISSLQTDDIEILQIDTTDKLLIYRRGSIYINNQQEEYELSYYECAEFDKYLILKVHEEEYYYKLNASFNADDVVLAEVTENKGGECIILDVNGDYHEDILINIGIKGRMIFHICYVYDETTDSFIFIDEFDTLPFIKYYQSTDSNEPYFISESTSEVGFYRAYRKYVIEGDKLVQKASLYYAWNSFINPNGVEVPGRSYTETKFVNGREIVVKDRIDVMDYTQMDLDRWHIEGFLKYYE